MKISIICTEFPPNYRGGLGIYMDRVIKQLQKEDHELSLYTLNYPLALPRIEVQKNLTVHRISPCTFTRNGLDKTRGKLSLQAILYNALNLAMFNWHVFRKLWTKHRAKDIGILAVHDWMCVPAALLLYRLTGQALVFHVHSTEMSMNLHGTNGFTPKVAAWLETQIARVAKNIIVPSDEIKAQLVSFGWAAEKIDVVHHGFEDDALQAMVSNDEQRNEELSRLRTTLSIAAGTKVLLFAGRLITHKGVETLLQAMPQVIAAHTDIRLIFVGSGEAKYQTQMQRFIVEHNLTAHVYAYYEQMPQAQVIAHYCLADLCIFPSTYEPFGFVALEAMTFAKPVVLGCGFSAVIRAPHLTGLAEQPISVYAHTNHPDEIARCIIELLDSPEQAQQLGQRAQRYVQKQFRWKKTSEQTLAVYQRLNVN